LHGFRGESTRSATRKAFLAPPDGEYVTTLGPSAGHLAVVISGRGGNKVRRYRLD
jgi:hypothetical protein